ncbi:MAG: hypothetical protein LBF40_10905 [Deltaproteobacteria bacterium]|nr:hypothetical protein [Deltaproteobacteria bacterium]
MFCGSELRPGLSLPVPHVDGVAYEILATFVYGTLVAVIANSSGFLAHARSPRKVLLLAVLGATVGYWLAWCRLLALFATVATLSPKSIRPPLPHPRHDPGKRPGPCAGCPA